MSQKVYITTAIPYVNGTPHIGHAEDYLLADIYYRYKTIQGHQVRLQAGTDEHGNKIERKALDSRICRSKFTKISRFSRKIQYKIYGFYSHYKS